MEELAIEGVFTCSCIGEALAATLAYVILMRILGLRLGRCQRIQSLR
jgi:hypothetical protein